MTTRKLCEELNAKKAALHKAIQTAETSRQPRDARLPGSELRKCFPQPVCFEVTAVSETTMVGEALRWEEKKEEAVKEDKEWMKEKNRAILERGKATEKAGWDEGEVPEAQEELAEELMSALAKARL